MGMFFLIQFLNSFVSVNLLAIGPMYVKIYGKLEWKKHLRFKNDPKCEVEVLRSGS